MEPSGNDLAIKAEIRTCVLKSACSLSTELKESELFVVSFFLKWADLKNSANFLCPSSEMARHTLNPNLWRLIKRRKSLERSFTIVIPLPKTYWSTNFPTLKSANEAVLSWVPLPRQGKVQIEGRKQKMMKHH